MNTRVEPTEGKKPFELRRYFSLASGLIILALVLVLAFTYRYTEFAELTGQAGLRNEMLARTYANALWPEFGQFLLDPAVDSDARREHADTRRLHQRIAEMSNGVPVIKVKVYNRAGMAVYSSVLAEIGEDKSTNQAFRQALAGELVNELTHRGVMSVSEGEIRDVDVVSTYIPLRSPGDIQPIAVFELYSNVTEIVARLDNITIRLFLALWAVFLLLYLALLAIVAHADRILKGQTARLKENEAWLQAKADELQREIVERREIEQALRRSEKLAAAASRAKSEFLSAMSHELRTPLNAILGFAQILHTEPGAPLSDNQKKFVGQITKAGDHLLGLINQVLDLARIESGKMTLSIEPVALQPLVDECLPLVQKLAGERQLGPIRVETDDLHVRADYFRLKQVLLNLLSNAIKYNQQQGEVGLKAERQGELVRISVSDTGPGIPEHRLPELFEPFNRLDRETTEIEGTGIGLALSRRLVESMQGMIGVDTTVGRGSTFWIELPLALPPSSASAPPAAVETPLRPQASMSGRTVLYVEDNPANQMVMEELFHRIPDVRLMIAGDGLRAITVAREQRPDLVILDINLPGIDGYEVLRRLRATPETARTPVIAVSANAMPHDIQRGLAAGFESYHTKPLDFDAFLQTIADRLGKLRQ